MNNKHVYLVAGSSGGKTSVAIGATMRTLGHGKNVLFIQFLKYFEKTGELLFADVYKNLCSNKNIGEYPIFSIKQFGRDGWVGIKSLGEKDRMECLKAINYIKDIVSLSQCVDLVVLDEINFAFYTKMLTFEEVTDIVTFCLRYNTNVYMTGRCPDKDMLAQLLTLADIGNEIRNIKGSDTMLCDEGIQF